MILRITSSKMLVGVLALVSALASPCAVASSILTEPIARRNAILYQPGNLAPAGGLALGPNMQGWNAGACCGLPGRYPTRRPVHKAALAQCH
jgi:hypothetical protein